MKFAALLAVVLAAVLAFGSAMAVPSGKTVEYAGADKGKVVFDGKVHADKGLKCPECHTKIWPMKKGTAMKMADLNGGKFCGTCHDGKKAFKTSDDKNCAKCHKK